MDFAVTLYLYLHVLTEGIYHGNAYAMKAAGNLVAITAELAPGMEHRQNNLHGRLAGFMQVNRNAAAIIGNGDAVVLMNHHVDIRAVACQRLIYGIVHHLVDKVMESPFRGAADVHARTLPDCLQPFQNLNLLGTVFTIHSGNLGTYILKVNPYAGGIRLLADFPGFLRCHAEIKRSLLLSFLIFQIHYIFHRHYQSSSTLLNSYMPFFILSLRFFSVSGEIGDM